MMKNNQLTVNMTVKVSFFKQERKRDNDNQIRIKKKNYHHRCIDQYRDQNFSRSSYLRMRKCYKRQTLTTKIRQTNKRKKNPKLIHLH